MSKVIVYVGRNIHTANFQIEATLSKIAEAEGFTIVIDDNYTVKKLPETGLHPTDIALDLINSIVACKDSSDLHITTHSKVVIDTIGELIGSNVVDSQNVIIKCFNDDNTLDLTANFDKEGYLENWRIGALSQDFSVIEEKIKSIKL